MLNKGHYFPQFDRALIYSEWIISPKEQFILKVSKGVLLLPTLKLERMFAKSLDCTVQ